MTGSHEGSSCCTNGGCSTSVQSSDDVCPACGSKGVRVDRVTLKALLTSTGLRRGIPPAPRFCASVECEVVYFDNGSDVVFRETDLIVPVHAKQPDSDDVPVCYCFGHTPKAIREEIVLSGASTATAVISAEVKAGRCACEVRNPKGSCCLGDIARVTSAELARNISGSPSERSEVPVSR